MAERPLTAGEVKTLLDGQNRELVAAMRDANDPLERELERVNAHLAKLNGQVAKHAEALAKGGGVIDRLKEDLERINQDERRHHQRREEDQTSRAALVTAAVAAAFKERDERRGGDEGDNRRVTWLHVRLFAAGAGAMLAVFLFLWQIWPLLQKVGQP